MILAIEEVVRITLKVISVTINMILATDEVISATTTVILATEKVISVTLKVISATTKVVGKQRVIFNRLMLACRWAVCRIVHPIRCICISPPNFVARGGGGGGLCGVPSDVRHPSVRPHFRFRSRSQKQ